MDPDFGYVYMIRCLSNNLVYIGQTIQKINSRYNKHRTTLNSKTHRNKRLQNSWNKYGQDAFEFKVLMTIEHSQLTLAEEYFYNLVPSNLRFNSMRPGPHPGFSKDAIESISASSKAAWNSESYREAISKSRRAMWQDPEYLLKIKARQPWNKGKSGYKLHTEASKAKITENLGFKIEKIEINTGLVTEYSSIRSAAKDGFNVTSIRRVLAGTSKQYAECFWIRTQG